MAAVRRCSVGYSLVEVTKGTLEVCVCVCVCGQQNGDDEIL